jgi:hypothetical protein
MYHNPGKIKKGFRNFGGKHSTTSNWGEGQIFVFRQVIVLPYPLSILPEMGFLRYKTVCEIRLGLKNPTNKRGLYTRSDFFAIVFSRFFQEFFPMEWVCGKFLSPDNTVFPLLFPVLCYNTPSTNKESLTYRSVYESATSKRQ